MIHIELRAMRSFAMVVVAMAMVMVMVMAMASSVNGACSNDLTPYKSCMAAVVGTEPALPTAECCTAIKQADLTCLCSAVASSDLPHLNQDAALMLPKRCGVNPPGITTCGKHGNPFARKLMDLH